MLQPSGRGFSGAVDCTPSRPTLLFYALSAKRWPEAIVCCLVPTYSPVLGTMIAIEGRNGAALPHWLQEMMPATVEECVGSLKSADVFLAELAVAPTSPFYQTRYKGEKQTS